MASLAYSLDSKEQMGCNYYLSSSLLSLTLKEHFLRCQHLYRHSCQPFANHYWWLRKFPTRTNLHSNLYRSAFSHRCSVTTSISRSRTVSPSYLIWSVALSSLLAFASLISVPTSLWRKLGRARRTGNPAIIPLSNTKARMLSILPWECRKGNARQLWLMRLWIVDIVPVRTPRNSHTCFQLCL